MGGDQAPGMVIEGIALSGQTYPDVRFLVFGNGERIAPLLEKFPRLKETCILKHTADFVTDEEKPSVALRSGRKSSMRLAIDAVADGEASAVISAGNTGALMAMAKMVLKTLPGIDRPAIATYFPTQKGEAVMLDLGANIDCDADNLVQFAVMGEVFARNVLGLEQPSVGLLNVGVEGAKGNEAVRKAALVLQTTDLPIKFYGFIEGDDIGAGTVDVIVTDGFTGNVALKTAEGTIHMFVAFMKESLASSPLAGLGALLARGALKKVRARFDPRRYNGAMLLGLGGICVKSHGGTDAMGFANALRVAIELVAHGINDGIKADLAHLLASSQPTDSQAAAG